MATDARNPLDVTRKLFAQMVRRRPVVMHCHDYYDGKHNLAFASEKFVEAFGGLFQAFADNWCEIVVNAKDERLGVQGFRVGKEPEVDPGAKAIWERNDLGLQSGIGHLDGLIGGAFYATVWNGEKDSDDGPELAEITVESPLNCIVECHPKIRRRRTAGLRVWTDDDGFEHAELFRPEGVYLSRSKSKRSSALVDPLRAQWVVEDLLDVASELDQNGMMPNPLGVVPIVEFINKPRLTASRAGWGAHSELAAVIPLNDAGNKLVADLLVASEFAAFPQRHLTGYSPDEITDAEGEPTGAYKSPNFKSGAGALWWLEDDKAKFGQFDAAELSGTVNAVGMIVNHIAAVSATPAHYLDSSADRLSGESIKSSESGLIARVRKRQTWWGAGWEEVMRLAGKLEQNPALANAASMATVWTDPEVRTESEHTDALVKKKALNVPEPQLWEELGYDSDTVARFPAMRAQMQLENLAANAADSARLATENAARLRDRSVAATGAVPVA